LENSEVIKDGLCTRKLGTAKTAHFRSVGRNPENILGRNACSILGVRT